MSLQAFKDLSPERKRGLKEMSKVNLAAAIVLGAEAGFGKEAIVASAFTCVLATLHAFGVTSEDILGIVRDVLALVKPPEAHAADFTIVPPRKRKARK